VRKALRGKPCEDRLSNKSESAVAALGSLKLSKNLDKPGFRDEDPGTRL